MTRRSEPRRDCARCKGSGVVMVGRDPDRDVDCVCTDPAGVVEFAEAALGVALFPWQRRVLERWVA